jgi:hypothetical protein
MIILLKNALTITRLTPDAAMNLLQENGVVSDNCVTLEDVATKDQERAAQWLYRWLRLKGKIE